MTNVKKRRWTAEEGLSRIAQIVQNQPPEWNTVLKRLKDGFRRVAPDMMLRHSATRHAQLATA